MFKTVENSNEKSNEDNMLTPKQAQAEVILRQFFQYQNFDPERLEFIYQNAEYLDNVAEILSINIDFLINIIRKSYDENNSSIMRSAYCNYFLEIYRLSQKSLSYVVENEYLQKDKAIIKQLEQVTSYINACDSNNMNALANDITASINFFMSSAKKDAKKHLTICRAQPYMLRAYAALFNLDERLAIASMLQALSHIKDNIKTSQHDDFTIEAFLHIQHVNILYLLKMGNHEEASIMSKSYYELAKKYYDQHNNYKNLLLSALQMQCDCCQFNGDDKLLKASLDEMINLVDNDLIKLNLRFQKINILFTTQKQKAIDETNQIVNEALENMDNDDNYIAVFEKAADIYEKNQDYVSSYPLRLKTYDTAIERLGKKDSYTIMSTIQLCESLYMQKRYIEAKRHIINIIGSFQQDIYHISQPKLDLLMMLGKINHALELQQESLVAYEHAYIIMRILYGGEDERVIDHMLMLSSQFLALNAVEKAYQYLISQFQYVNYYPEDHVLWQKYMRIYKKMKNDYPDIINDASKIMVA